MKAHQARLSGLEVHYGMGLLITVSADKTIKVIRLSSLEEVRDTFIDLLFWLDEIVRVTMVTILW